MTTCNKIINRIECFDCGYPRCESMWPDADSSLPCNSSDEVLGNHIDAHIRECNKILEAFFERQNIHKRFDNALGVITDD